jgi:hypothetical protein
MTAALSAKPPPERRPGRNVVAYIGYDSGLRPSSDRTRVRPARAKLAWGRLAAVAASLLAWVGIIAAARAIF